MKGMKLVACLIPSFIVLVALHVTPKAGASPTEPHHGDDSHDDDPHPPSPSQQPTCDYSCPSNDHAGFPFSETRREGITLFCSCPTFPKEDPNHFFCRYHSEDGHLIQDHNKGLCPQKASKDCHHHRRELTRVQSIIARQNSERATRRAISAIKKSMLPEEYYALREKKLEEALKLVAEA